MYAIIFAAGFYRREKSLRSTDLTMQIFSTKHMTQNSKSDHISRVKSCNIWIKFVAILLAALFAFSCGGGGGGGGGMVAFSPDKNHNGGDAGGWGTGNQTGSGFDPQGQTIEEAEAGPLFSQMAALDVSTVDIRLNIGNVEQPLIVADETTPKSVLPKIKPGTIVSGSATIHLRDGTTRTAYLDETEAQLNGALKFKVPYYYQAYNLVGNLVSSGTYFSSEGINLSAFMGGGIGGWTCVNDGSTHYGSYVTGVRGDITLNAFASNGEVSISAGVIKTDLHTGSIPSVGETLDYETLTGTTVSGNTAYITVPPLPAGTLFTESQSSSNVSWNGSYTVDITIDGNNNIPVSFNSGDTQSKKIINIPLGATISASAAINVAGAGGYTSLDTETASSTVQAGGNLTMYVKYPLLCSIGDSFTSGGAAITGSSYPSYYTNNGTPTDISSAAPTPSYNISGTPPQTMYFGGWALNSTATTPVILGNSIPADGTYKGALNLYAVYSSCSVSINEPATRILAEGTSNTSLTLSATSNGFSPSVTYTWSVENQNANTAVAVNSSTGVVTIVPGKTGTATIKVTATDGTYTAQNTINISVVALSLTEGPIYIEKGNNFEITASVPNYGNGVNYDWSLPDSSFNLIATTASGNGVEKTLGATAGGKSTITVTATITAGNIQLPPKSIDVYVVDMQLSCSDFSPSNSYNIAMTSSATDYSWVAASLTGTGMPNTTFNWAYGTGSSAYLELDGTTGTPRKITSKAAGTGTVTVSTTCGTVTVSKTINVSVVGISQPAGPIVLTKGGSGQQITPSLTAVVSGATWSWTPPDSSIATLSDSGDTRTINPMAGGHTTLTVSTYVNGRQLSKTIDVYVLDLTLSGSTGAGVVNSTDANIDYDLIMDAADTTGKELTASLAGFTSGVTYTWTQPSPYATLNGTNGAQKVIQSTGTAGSTDFTLTASIDGVTGASITKTIKLKAAGITITGASSFVYDGTPQNYSISVSSGINLNGGTISYDEVNDTGNVASIEKTGAMGIVTAAKGGTYTISASGQVSGTSITLTTTKTITVLRPRIMQGGSEVATSGNTLTCSYNPNTTLTLNGMLEGLTANISWSASPEGIVSFSPESATNTTGVNTTVTVNTPGDVDITMTATYNGTQYTKTASYSIAAQTVTMTDIVDNNFLVNLPDTDADHPCVLNITGINSSNIVTLGDKLRDLRGTSKYIDLSKTTLPDNITNMHSVFQWCSTLTAAPNIPANVTDMSNCFDHGTYGTHLAGPSPIIIPANVTNMEKCFFANTALRNVDIYIYSESVNNWNKAFMHINSTTQNVTVYVVHPDVKTAILADGNYNSPDPTYGTDVNIVVGIPPNP